MKSPCTKARSSDAEKHAEPGAQGSNVEGICADGANTSGQLALFEVRAPRIPTRASQFDDQARDLIAAHPDVWSLFCRFAFELIRANRKHGGAKAICERIRWETWTSAHASHGAPALNNNVVASLARIFAETYPEHREFFRTRERRSESKPARAA